MADESDVETALVSLAALAVYPAGATAASLTGAVVRVYRGWPGNTALESDLACGICHVSVAGIAGGQEPAAAFPQVWEYPDPVIPSLNVATGDGAVNFSGSAASGQLAGILADETAFVYRTATGDTPELVAAALCAQISRIRAAAVTGASVSVPAATRLLGRVVADQTALMQTRRQRGGFRLTCWCPDPTSRDRLAAAIDGVFATRPFLDLADGSVGRLLYLRSELADDLSTLPLYRRDLDYNVEYATTIVQTQPSMLFGLFQTGGTPPRVTLS